MSENLPPGMGQDDWVPRQRTSQEQFEEDYLAAFPKPPIYMDKELVALRVWQQQAARHALEVESLKATHKAEIDQFVKYVKHVRDTFDKDLSAGYKTRDKEFAVELLSACLKCLDGRQPSESCGGDAEYKRLCKLQDATIAKYEEKQ